MIRFVGPLLFFAIAGYIGVHNAGAQRHEMWLLPGLDSIPAIQGSMHTQGMVTCILLAAIGVLLLVWAVFGVFQDRAHRDRNDMRDRRHPSEQDGPGKY